MPLKVWKRKTSKGDWTYYVRGTVGPAPGIPVYRSANTQSRAAAQGFAQKLTSELYPVAVHGERIVRTFQEAADSYVEAVGPSYNDYDRITKLVAHFGAKLVSSIKQADVDEAYRKILQPGAAPSTRQRQVLTPLTAILKHAARREWCSEPDFERPEVPEGRTRWLTPKEYMDLEEAAAAHLRPLLRFMVCTGARVAEAIELDWSKVDLQDARATLHVKGGGTRHADLPPLAIAALSALPHRTGPVFLRPKQSKVGGELHVEMVPYVDRGRTEGGQIKTAFKAACRRADLGWWEKDAFETDVTPHVLRHSFASWFYAVTKDAYLLRKAGGWSTADMCERYAHLMKQELVPTIAMVWGASHPLIDGAIYARAIGAGDVQETVEVAAAS